MDVDPARVLDGLVLELLGAYAWLQESIEHLADRHVAQTAPGVRLALERTLKRLNDDDRVRWLRGVVQDAGVDEVPVDAIVQAFAGAKAIRDHIAHGIYISAEGNGPSSVLHVIRWGGGGYGGVITEQVLTSQLDKLRWAKDWVIWLLVRLGHVQYRVATDDDSWVDRQPPMPTALPPSS